MRRSITTVWASICFVGLCGAGACSARTDGASSTGSGSSSSAGSSTTGSGTTTTGNGGCKTGYTSCDTLCCAPGKICAAPGRCEYPYSTAQLWVYLCPSFNTGNCKATFFSIDQTCTPLRDPQPGTCYNTGFEVAGGQSYGISSCTACGMNCGNPSSLATPAGFTKPDYFSGMAFYCGTPCTAPPECSQAANVGGPGMTGTTGSGAGGASVGAGGAGGSFGTGSGSGGSSTTTTTTTGGGGSNICNTPGSTKQCSQMIACPNCSFQSCTCFDGSNCSAGYHTSDGLDFPCASCPNGCTAAAQAVIQHCGCAM